MVPPQFLRTRVCITSAGYGGVSPEGGDGLSVFDMSDGEETERTVLDSTDCESKVTPSRPPPKRLLSCRSSGQQNVSLAERHWRLRRASASLRAF